jgi:hypothetical protein
MFPKQTTTEKFLRKPPNVYGSIEHTFYAFEDNSPIKVPDFWNPEKEENTLPIWEGYTYFTLNTMVGVGAKGRNNIKNVHIRFTILSMNKKVPEAEVVSIYPNNISKKIGEVKQMRKIESELRAEGKLDANPVLGFFIKPFISLSGKKEITKAQTTEASFAYEILVANASGTANRAIWEFYRGESVTAIGQYNLKIRFRIKDPAIYDKGSYCIDWNVEVNGRKLRDHQIELANNYWNLEFNGRKVMDHIDENLKDENPNVKWRNIENSGKVAEIISIVWKGKEIDFNEEDTNEIKELVKEEDPEAKNRMLRPLTLVKGKSHQTQ